MTGAGEADPLAGWPVPAGQLPLDEAGPAREWVLELSWRRPPLSGNDRIRWQARHRITQEILEEVGWRLRAAKVPPLHRCSVQLHWAPARGGRRDPDNLVASQKVCADAVVRQGIAEDDTPAFMDHLIPKLHPPEPPRGRMWLTIQEAR